MLVGRRRRECLDNAGQLESVDGVDVPLDVGPAALYGGVQEHERLSVAKRGLMAVARWRDSNARVVLTGRDDVLAAPVADEELVAALMVGLAP